jgi:hypothetical protein
MGVSPTLTLSTVPTYEPRATTHTQGDDLTDLGRLVTINIDPQSFSIASRTEVFTMLTVYPAKNLCSRKIHNVPVEAFMVWVGNNKVNIQTSPGTVTLKVPVT